MKKTLVKLFIVAALLGGCTSGETFDSGLIRRENVWAGLFDFHRDQEHVSYSLFYEYFLTTGTTKEGNYFSYALWGLYSSCNTPGWTMVLYPFQYIDAPEEAKIFGIGSGRFELRISLLWGLLTLGRNWNIGWYNGFWTPSNDPMLHPELYEEDEEKPSEEKPAEGEAAPAPAPTTT